MDRVPFGEARARLAELVNRVTFAHERVVLQRRGKDVAVLISPSDLEYLESLEALAEEAWAKDKLRKARRVKGKPVSLERVRKELGL